jgi:hypothetical protein
MEKRIILNNRVKELVDFTRDKWGLDSYYLHTCNFYRKLNVFNETIYTLSMEWFPFHITHQEDENHNPDGTAVIDIIVNNRQFESVIFVGDKTFADRRLVPSIEINEIIKFIECETGLIYEKQFHLQSDEEKEFVFRSNINCVAVSPSGNINIKFNEEGKMTFFSLHGPFPSMDMVNEETFGLKLKDVEHVAKEQLKLFQFPLIKQKKMLPVYCIEEIYITNDQSKTLPFAQRGLVYTIDELLHWEKSNKKSFKRKQMNLIENVTADQAFSFEPHPDLYPIKDSEKWKCISSVKDFLGQVYHRDSGKWRLKTLHRENGYILGTIRLINQEGLIFQRKLMLFIDSITFKVLNYMDNKDFIEIYDEYQETESLNINLEYAFERIKTIIDLKPVYVFDFEQRKYILCGRIDCDRGINGINGEVMELNDL